MIKLIHPGLHVFQLIVIDAWVDCYEEQEMIVSTSPKHLKV